jgi:hypothetical protein
MDVKRYVVMHLVVHDMPVAKDRALMVVQLGKPELSETGNLGEVSTIPTDAQLLF